MSQHPFLLHTPEQIVELSQQLQNEPMIGFDTEFIRESTFFPIIEIIQIATGTDSWLVDARSFKKNYPAQDPNAYDLGIQPLLNIFKNPNILKIAHAAQGDQECLYCSFGSFATPLLDTAVAASLCGYGDQMGLGNLLDQVLGRVLQKGHARTDWSARPLPTPLIHYAHSDVQYLVALGKKMLGLLEVAQRASWALELSSQWAEPSLYQVNIDVIYQKLVRGKRFDPATEAVLYRLVQWREHRIRELNLPRRWLADDQVLLDIAQAKPQTFDHLVTFRGFNRGELKKKGSVLLEIIQQALQACPTESERTKKAPPSKPLEKPLFPTRLESQVMAFVDCVMGLLAEKHQLSIKHLMNKSHFVTLLRQKVTQPLDFVREGILTEKTVNLIGNDLLELLQGKIALKINQNRLEMVHLKEPSVFLKGADASKNREDPKC